MAKRIHWTMPEGINVFDPKMALAARLLFEVSVELSVGTFTALSAATGVWFTVFEYTVPEVELGTVAPGVEGAVGACGYIGGG